MKKYKFFVLIIGIFTLVGCSSEYNLIISDNEITEDINVVILDNQETSNNFDLDFYPLHSNFDEIYEKNIIKENDFIRLNLKYNYSPQDFSNANSFNECFHDKEVVLNNEDYYYLKLSEFYPCVTASEFDINIITDNKVLMNNADIVKGNKYTWHVDENNKADLLIEIKIAKGIKAYNNSKLISYIVIGSILFILFVVMIVFFKKSNGRNEI